MRSFHDNSIIKQVTIAIIICSVIASALVGFIIANQAIEKMNALTQDLPEPLQPSVRAETRQIRQDLFINTVILVVIIGIFSFFVSFNLSSSIIQPLEKLIDHIPVLSRGDFHQAVEEDLLFYANEIGKLARAFEDMRTQLQTSFNHFQSMNASLEQKVAERTAELQSVNHQLKQSYEDLQQTQDQLINSRKQVAIQNLIKGVTHLLNTPLGNAITATSYVQMQLPNETVSRRDLEDSLQMAYDNLKQCRTLLDTFKKIAPTSVETTHEALETKTYITQCIDILLGDQKFNHLKVELNLEPNLYILASRIDVLQLLTTLLNNTVDHGYGPEGGRVFIGTKRIGDHMELDFLDWGSGVSVDIADQIFEPFFTTRRSGQTAGLGLSLIHAQIVNKLHGNIQCLPQETGARFVVSLPLKEGGKV